MKKFKKGLLGVAVAALMLLLVDNVENMSVVEGYVATSSCTSTADCTGSYINGICNICSQYESASVVSDEHYPDLNATHAGYYAIENAGQLYWFASQVNANAAMSAVLTDDIVVNENVLDSNGDLNSGDFKAWTPMSGNFTFDGNFHTISGLVCNSSGDIGFANVASKKSTTICNVGIVDSFFSGSGNVGTIVGLSWNGMLLIDNCYSNATVKTTGSGTTGSAGGIVGRYKGDCSVNNCFFAGKAISVNSYVGGIIGRVDDVSKVTNCYYLTGSATSGNGTKVWKGIGDQSDPIEDIEGRVSGITKEQLASGEVAYLLQEKQSEHIWGQDLSKDKNPILKGIKVYPEYGEGTCKVTGYSNTEVIGDVTHAEYGEEGVCLNCGEFEEPILITNDNCNDYSLNDAYDGYYAIGNYGQLYSFVKASNTTTGGLNGVLVDDILVNEQVFDDGSLVADTSSLISWTSLKNYSAIFDGNNHYISGLYVDGATDYTGFISIGAPTVKNLLIKDSYFKGSKYTGGIIGYFDGGSIIGCGFDGYIESSSDVGGIVGLYLRDGIITDCYNWGMVVCTSDLSYAGGIVSSITSSTNDAIVKNCYNTGLVSGGKYRGGIGGLCSGNSDVYIDSCYYLEGTADQGNGYKPDVDVSRRSITAEQLTIGQLSYMLDSYSDDVLWGQNLEDASYPIPNGKAVYPIYDGCKIIAYTNDVDESKPANHNYNNGICSECSHIEPATLITEGNLTEFTKLDESYIGYYAIGNYGQLTWYRDFKIHSGRLTEKAVLIADITVNENVLTNEYKLNSEGNFTTWNPIGNDTYTFKGTFDGKGHTISGLYIDTNNNYVGMFGKTSGAIIKDLKLADSYIKGGEYVGGIVGYYYYGSNIEDITVDAVVIGSEYVGGIVGYYCTEGICSSLNSSGKVSGSSYVGGIFGRTYYTSMEKCKNTAIIEGSGDYIGGIGGMIAGADAVGLINNGSVTGVSYVGGIVGNNYIDLSKSYNTADIKGISHVGGITGNGSSDITYCYNTGDVTGEGNDGYVGGITGEGDVQYCYNIGTVTGSIYIGAITGKYSSYNGSGIEGNYYLEGCATDLNGTVMNACGHYVAGSVQSDKINGVTSVAYPFPLESFESGELAWVMNGGGNKAPTDGTQIWYQTLDENGSPNFDGKTVYYGYVSTNCDLSERIYSNDKLYFIQTHNYNEEGFCQCGRAEPPVLITADNLQNYEKTNDNHIGYYAIENIGNLYWFSRLTNGDLMNDFIEIDNTANAVLVSDIVENMNSSSLDTMRIWEPICREYSNQFVGVFDGCGYSLDGLINFRKDTALFKYAKTDSIIKNIVVKNAMLGNAIICVNNYGGTIENCVVTYLGGIFNFEKDKDCGAGGICKNNEGIVRNCTFNGGIIISDDLLLSGVENGVITTEDYDTVSGEKVGGIAARNEGTIINCTNNAEFVIDANAEGSMLGGIVGYMTDGSVKNCYSTSDIEGNYQVGGIIGYLGAGSIENCYNTGNINAKNNIGAVVGCKDTDATVSGCYYLVDCAKDIDGIEDYSLDDGNYTGSGETDGIAIIATGIGVEKYYNIPKDIEGITIAVSSEDFASGRIAYILNGSTSEGDVVWGQDLKVDDTDNEYDKIPVIGGAKVYYGFVSCAEDAVQVYTNNENVFDTKPEHKSNEDDGDCTTPITCNGCEKIMTQAKESHDCDYSLDMESGSVILITCQNCTKQGMIMISASNTSYTGMPVIANVLNTYDDMDYSSSIVYVQEDGNSLDSVPISCGTYIASITLGEDAKAVTASVKYTIDHVDENKDGECDGCKASLSGVKLKGSSITLSGTIGMNFYFEFDNQLKETIWEDETAMVRFSLADGRIIDIPVNEGVEDANATEGEILYKYCCELYAKQMADNVKVQFIMNDKVLAEYEHSVANYAKVIIANEEGNYSQETINLVKAMLNYGANAQMNFGYNYTEGNEETLANALLTKDDKNLADITVDTFKDYKVTGTTIEGIGTFTSSNLVLESETTLKIYFKPVTTDVTLDKLTFKVGENEVTATKYGDYFMIAITNIKANELDTPFTITVSDGINTGTFECSVFSYCYSVLSDVTDTFSDELKNTVKALYLYNQTADAYANSLRKQSA